MEYYVGVFLRVLLVIFSIFLLYLFNYYSMIALKNIQSNIHFDSLPLDNIIPLTFIKITFASFGIIAIQFIISILFQNFIYSLEFGVLATFSTAFLINWGKIVYFHYSFTFFAAQDLRLGSSIFFTNQVLSGFIVGLIVGIIGYYIHSNKRVI